MLKKKIKKILKEIFNHKKKKIINKASVYYLKYLYLLLVICFKAKKNAKVEFFLIIHFKQIQDVFCLI